MQGIYVADQVAVARRQVLSRLDELRRRVKDRALVSRGGDLLVHTRLQAMFNFRFDSELQRAIHEIVLTHAQAAERLGPGGFDMCIQRLLEYSGEQEGGNIPVALDKVLEALVGAGAASPCRTDIEWVIKEYAGALPEHAQALLQRALELAGFGGRIIIEKSRSVPSVELIRGYTFEQAPAWPISVRLDAPKVICIDGYVEQVSEIHHLLEEAAESHEQVMLFVRGLSDDVINTLRVNYDRGSLRVIPVIVKFDTEGINALNDISIAAGCDLVSSNKGDLISAVRLMAAPRVDEALLHFDRVVIAVTSTRRAVETQVNFLRRKREEEKVDEVARLFDARIKSLSPNHVVIRLRDDKDYVATSQALDYALRAIRSLVDHGTLLHGDRRFLTTSLIAAEVHARRCHETLTSLGAVTSNVT